MNEQRCHIHEEAEMHPKEYRRILAEHTALRKGVLCVPVPTTVLMERCKLTRDEADRALDELSEEGVLSFDAILNVWRLADSQKRQDTATETPERIAPPADPHARLKWMIDTLREWAYDYSGEIVARGCVDQFVFLHGMSQEAVIDNFAILEAQGLIAQEDGWHVLRIIYNGNQADVSAQTAPTSDEADEDERIVRGKLMKLLKLRLENHANTIAARPAARRRNRAPQASTARVQHRANSRHQPALNESARPPRTQKERLHHNGLCAWINELGAWIDVLQFMQLLTNAFGDIFDPDHLASWLSEHWLEIRIIRVRDEHNHTRQLYLLDDIRRVITRKICG